MYGCRINRHSSCDLVPPSVPLGSFNPGRNLTDGKLYRLSLDNFLVFIFVCVKRNGGF